MFEEIKLSFGEEDSVLKSTSKISAATNPLIYAVWKDPYAHQNLENLKGIHVPVIDGSEILIYPKYKECMMLPESKIEKYNVSYQNNPLYPDTDQVKVTDELLKLGSEAAEFVRSFGMHIALPIQLMAIAKYKDEIDQISRYLGGDLLFNISSYWWASVRYNTTDAWLVYGGNGSFSYTYMYYSYQVLPVTPYNK